MNNNKSNTNIYPILWLFTILLFVTGCNETFEPWQDNDRYHFSIYGYLDASADTQWVRVMPVREDLLLKPGPIDAAVTLEHMESGEIATMNDSLFEFAHNAYAYNFWTTADLQPGQTYRMTAWNSAGDSSHVQITLPEDFPVPLVRIERRDQTGTPIRTTVVVQEVEQLADVQTIYRTVDNQHSYTFPHLQDSVRVASGELQIIMDPQEDYITLDVFFPLPPGAGSANFLDTPAFKQHIFIAAAGPDFHFFPSIDEKVVSLPAGVSNIVNGAGYLAGLVSKTIPYESCFEEDTNTLIPCETEQYPW